MGRNLSPKNKLARREGEDLGLKTFGTKAHASLLRRIEIIPGQKNTRRRRSKLSDYGRQLREKQKLKKIYNITENTLKKYFKKAIKTKGNTADNIIQLLEIRLDNVLYRSRMTPTRASARQLITHGHIKVNGKKLDIPSYLVKKEDKLEYVKEKTKEIVYIKEVLEEKNIKLPKWLKRTGLNWQVVADYSAKEYTEPIDMALVIEFYSKL